MSFTTLPKQQEKWSFFHCAHCVPITETPYPGTQPAAEYKKRFGFVLLGRTTARHSTKHKPASAAMVQEAAQLSSHFIQLQALFLCCCQWNKPSQISHMTAENERLQAESHRQQARYRSLANAALELPQPSQGLFFLGGEMVTLAALQATIWKPVTSQVTANSTAGEK